LDEHCRHRYLPAEIEKSLLLHCNTIRRRMTGFAAPSGLRIDHTSDFILAWWGPAVAISGTRTIGAQANNAPTSDASAFLDY
jgi:hypothetical protein